VGIEALLLAALASAVASPAKVTATVPPVFQGEWNAYPSQCGSATSEFYLVLGSRHIAEGKGHGRVLSVVTHGTREMALIAELAAGGERWLIAEQFVLSPNGHSLSSTANGEEYTWQRCPKPKGARPNKSFKPNPLRGSA
jgi:hypothetical protein